MRCIRCLKPLTRPALSILTRRGKTASEQNTWYDPIEVRRWWKERNA